MVEFQNGRFILRRRQQPAQSRLLLRFFPTAKLALFAVIVLMWGYLINKATNNVDDHDMLRASRDADIPTVVEKERVDVMKNHQWQQPQRDDDETPTKPKHVLNTFQVDNVGGGDGDNYSEAVESVDDDEQGEDVVGDEEGSEDEPNEGGGDEEEEEEEDVGSEDKPKKGEPVIIQLNQAFLKHLQTLDPIPKKVHMFFPDKLYYKKEPILPFVSHSIISLMNLNRDYNVTVYDDDMVDRVIQNAGNEGLLSKEEVAVLIGEDGKEGPKQKAHIVERTDIARLILMYTEGGVYLDVDRLVGKRFGDIFTPSTRLCLPTHFGINFAQDIMCSSRGNELFLSIIREASSIRMKSERRKGWLKSSTLYDLGVFQYNTQILMKVFGMDSDAYERFGDNEGFYAQARDAILTSSQGTIITKKEMDYCIDTLVLDDTLPGCPDRGELYERYSMTPWSAEVDAVWKKD